MCSIQILTPSVNDAITPLKLGNKFEHLFKNLFMMR